MILFYRTGESINYYANYNFYIHINIGWGSFHCDGDITKRCLMPILPEEAKWMKWYSLVNWSHLKKKCFAPLLFLRMQKKKLGAHLGKCGTQFRKQFAGLRIQQWQFRKQLACLRIQRWQFRKQLACLRIQRRQFRKQFADLYLILVKKRMYIACIAFTHTMTSSSSYERSPTDEIDVKGNYWFNPSFKMQVFI